MEMNVYQRRYLTRRIDEEAKKAIDELTRDTVHRVQRIAQGVKDRIMLDGKASFSSNITLAVLKRQFRSESVAKKPRKRG